MPKNVLMILADQHHAGLMGCAGHSQAITPNLDRLASEGVLFNRAYAQSPICTPSRVSILSGQYCHNHGYYGLAGPTPYALPNLFGHFRNHGYRTAGIGKLHLPLEGRGNWIAQDVDLFADTYEMADTNVSHAKILAEGKDADSPFLRDLRNKGLRKLEDSWHNYWNYGKGTISLDARPSMLAYEHTQERWCAKQAMSFIDQNRSKPFFIQVSFQKPHHPLLPQQKFWDMYSPNLKLPDTFEKDPSHRPPHFQCVWQNLRKMDWDYARSGDTYVDGARRIWRGTLACITQIDDVLGIMLDYLEEKDLADNTIVIYGSDHGGYHTIHGLPEKAPGICSDAVCRVPMIWRVPQSTNGGNQCHQLVENIDMSATLPALCNLPAMESTDGKDISELLNGSLQSVRNIAVTEHPWSKSVCFDHWRLVHYQPEMFDDPNVGELYDMNIDPNETKNLYDDPSCQSIIKKGKRLLCEWLIRTTRITTCLPPIDRKGNHNYDLAGDGKEANAAGPQLRLQYGNRNYI